MENIEQRIEKIEQRLQKLETENDILKIELGNSIVEKHHLDEAKQNFVDRHIAQIAKMEEQIEEEVKQMQEYIRTLRERCLEIEKENEILLSERSKGLLKEVLRQAKTSRNRTGDNPFGLSE